jgi:hypothetical protein
MASMKLQTLAGLRQRSKSLQPFFSPPAGGRGRGRARSLTETGLREQELLRQHFRISECNGAWCRFDVKGQAGFVPVGSIWGVDPGEVLISPPFFSPPAGGRGRGRARSLTETGLREQELLRRPGRGRQDAMARRAGRGRADQRVQRGLVPVRCEGAGTSTATLPPDRHPRSNRPARSPPAPSHRTGTRPRCTR